MSETAARPGPGNVANLPARSAFKKLSECKSLKEAFATEELRSLVAQALPRTIQMTAEAMIRTWIQAAGKNEGLMYKADVRQVLGMFQSLAFLGLVPNTHLGHAHMIPFKTKRWNPETRKRDIDAVDLNVIIGYPGYIELGHRSNAINPPHADVVYNAQLEHFTYSQGSKGHLDHGMRPPTFVPNADPEYAYCYVKMKDGGENFEVMPWFEVQRIRDRSQAYITALASKERADKQGWTPTAYLEAAWVRDQAEMGKKTALRRLFKWLPKCPELRAATSLEDAQESKRLDFGPVIDGTISPLEGDIPEADDGPPPPADPGAAFTDRRPPADDTAAKAQAAAAEAERKRTLAAEQAAARVRAEAARKPPETKPAAPAAPEFEAFLIDPAGDATGPAFANPAQFARAFMMLWREADEAENGDAIEALLAFNADTIEQIRAEYPEAAAVLAEIDQPAEPERQTENPTAYVTVTPPIERGKTSWPAYVKAIRAEVEKHGKDALPAWLNLQKTTLSEVPFAQRLLAIRAISDRIAAFGLIPPAWLGDLMRASKPAGDPPADPRVADEKWVDRTVAEIEAITTRAEFDTYFRSSAIRTVMMRLKETASDLFDRADAAFGAKHQALPPADGAGAPA